MVEEQVDVEYISLHGYIRNTLLGTEVHAEHQLDWTGGPDQQKEYIGPCKSQQDEGTRGETGVSVGVDLPWPVGELKQGSDPHIGAIV